jgi:hypothetical protein
MAVGSVLLVPPVESGRGRGDGSAGVSKGATGAMAVGSAGWSKVVVPVEGSRVASAG